MGRASLCPPTRAGAALLLGLVAACQAGPPTPPPRGGGFARWGCAGCHGLRGEGGPAAPPLGDLARHWDEQRLVAYFRDPQEVAERDPRLLALSGSYPLKMPPVKTATDEELQQLARELLAD